MSTKPAQGRNRQEVAQLAADWYQRQLARFEPLHGAAWPENREWVSQYLLEQLETRLREAGWRERR